MKRGIAAWVCGLAAPWGEDWPKASYGGFTAESAEGAENKERRWSIGEKDALAKTPGRKDDGKFSIFPES